LIVALNQAPNFVIASLSSSNVHCLQRPRVLAVALPMRFVVELPQGNQMSEHSQTLYQQWLIHAVGLRFIYRNDIYNYKLESHFPLPGILIYAPDRFVLTINQLNRISMAQAFPCLNMEFVEFL
jgi:hypothetical protein